MTSISQSIPNLLSGISQQPDNRKRPGQLTDAVNVYPDFALGMLKRPGSKYLANLKDAKEDDSSKWFSILRDPTEKYVGQIYEGRFRIWHVVDNDTLLRKAGNVAPVNMGDGANKADIDNYNTALNNLVTAKETLQQKEKALAEALAGLQPTSQKLFDIRYGDGADSEGNPLYEYPIGEVVSSLRSGVLLESDGTYTVKVDDVVISSASTFLANYSIEEGDERTDEYPLIAQHGYRIWPVIKTIAPTKTQADVDTAQAEYDIALGLYGAAKGFDSGFIAMKFVSTGKAIDENNTVLTRIASKVYVAPNSSTTHQQFVDDWDHYTDHEVRMATLKNRAQLIASSNLSASYIIDIDANSFYVVADPDTGNINGSNTIVVENPNVSNDIPNDVDGNPSFVITYSHDAPADPTDNSTWFPATQQRFLSLKTYSDAYPALIPITGNYLTKDNATPDDIDLLTLNDTTFVVNKKVTPKMKYEEADFTSVTDRSETLFVIESGTSAPLSVVVNGDTENPLSVTNNANPVTFAKNLKDVLNAQADWEATQYGTTVHLKDDNGDDIDITLGDNANYLYQIQTEAQNVSRLPVQAPNGYRIKIVNTNSIDIDDMYVKFTAENGTGGIGTWSEDVAPRVTHKIDPTTMPHMLTRDANGVFQFAPITWDDRKVGDENTNPVPSFIENKKWDDTEPHTDTEGGIEISKIFFYRNRLGLLAGGNIFLSKAGDFFNLWHTTAQVTTDDDPIDISAAGTNPVFLKYALPTSVGLVLYAANEQFLLSTDSDILSPKTAKINSLSYYKCDEKISAVSFGTTQAFLSKSPQWTKIFELNDISLDRPPLMQDVTNVVPELIPSTVDSFTVSPDLSVVSLGTRGSSDIYQYRFLTKSREEKLVNSWYRWTLNGNLSHQFFDTSTLYTVTKNGSDVSLSSHDMNQSSSEGSLTLPTGEKTDVFLDYFVENPHRIYENDKTKVYLPYLPISGKNVTVLVTTDGQLYNAAVTDGYVEIDADLRGTDIFIGYTYKMDLKLPKIFVYKVQGDTVTNDDIADLVIHRLKVKLGLTGAVDYRINILGIPEFVHTVTVTEPNEYNLNTVNMQSRATHTVPLYQRNENLSISIEGESPYPISVLGYDWEGKYNKRFYRRA